MLSRFDFPFASLDAPIEKVLDDDLRMRTDRRRLALVGEGNSYPFDLTDHPLSKFIKCVVRARRALKRGDLADKRAENCADSKIVGADRVKHGGLLAAAKVVGRIPYHGEAV